MRYTILILCLALGACESEEHKLVRLKTDLAMKCVAAQDAMLPHNGYAFTDAEKAKRQTACDLAQRSFNRFMSGR